MLQGAVQQEGHEKDFDIPERHPSDWQRFYASSRTTIDPMKQAMAPHGDVAPQGGVVTGFSSCVEPLINSPSRRTSASTPISTYEPP